MVIQNTSRYTSNTVLNYFSQKLRRYNNLDYQYIDLTVGPFRDSWIESTRLMIDPNPPVVYGGFELGPIDRYILAQEFNDPNIEIGSTAGKWYEYGANSDINTIALDRGAKVGDTVRIHMYAINRKPLLFDLSILSDDQNSYAGKYFLYPYRSRDYLAGDENLPLNTVVYDEYPLNIWTVAGFQDDYWGGWVINQEMHEHQINNPFPNSNWQCYGPYARIRPRIHNWSGSVNMSTENWQKYDNAIGQNTYFRYYTADPSVYYHSNLRQNGWRSDGGGYQSFHLGCLYLNAYKPYSVNRIVSNIYDTKTKIDAPTFKTISIPLNLNDSRLGSAEIKLFTGTPGKPWVNNTTTSVIVWMEKISSAPVIIPLTPTTTATPTNTPNQTRTPTASKTPTPTPTNTITPSRSPDPTATPTNTPTTTKTPRSTRIISPTPTATPTISPSSQTITRGQLCVVRDINNPPYPVSKYNALSFNGERLTAGAVRYPYCIGKYEVTNYEYCEFLNAVGQSDANNIYMTPPSNPDGSPISPPYITRAGTSGSYTYSVVSGKENIPVVMISWLSAARYCNWLHKNKPNDPTGNTINTGAYDLTQYDRNKANNIVKRSADARYWIPNVNEWIKAAYYNPVTGGYYKFGNQSDDIPDYGTSGETNNGAVWRLQWHQGAQHVASFPNSVSYYGLNGISGNVKEYTDSMVQSDAIVLGSSFSSNQVQSIDVTATTNYITYMLNWGYSDLGFRIASTTGLTVQEQAVAIPPPPTPTPILSCKLSSENKTLSYANNQVCSHRFFVKNTPIKNIYGGLSLDTDEVMRLKAMGIDFSHRKNAESTIMPLVREYTVNSDLNSIALHMGAKPNDYVELEVNYVWRGHSIYIRDDRSGLVDIIPYGSYNPFFGKDFFRKYVNGADPGRDDGWKNIKVDGAAPTETWYNNGGRLYSQKSGWDASKNLLPANNYIGIVAVPYYNFGMLNLSEHDLDSITDIKLAYDPEYIQEYGSTSIRKIFKILTKDKVSTDSIFNAAWNPAKKWYNLSIQRISGTSFDGNYKTISNQKSTTVGPLSTDIGFTAPIGDGYWLDLQDSYSSTGLEKYRSVSYENYGAMESIRYLFNNWLESSPYGLVKKQLIESLKINIAETQKDLQTSLANKDGTSTQSLNKKLSDQQTQLSKLQNTSESTYFGQYTMLVKMTQQPPPPPPPSASPTPSLSRIGDVNNKIFAKSPNYQSAFSDEIHLKQYIDNPFMTNLKSTTNDNGTPGLIPNTRYLINSTIEGRKVTYQNSSGYTIEQWKNNITTIKFNQPAQQQGNVIIRFKLENDNTDRSYTVTVLKLKTVINTFSKGFWFGGSITNYSGDSLGSNSTYKKYIGELTKYRFKAYYRVMAGPDKNTESWTPIGNNAQETTLAELDAFSNNYQSQILIRSNNLNNDILFPKEGSPANPGYTNDNPTFFTINVQSRSLELRSVGASLKTPSSSVSEALKKVATGDNYTLNLHKDFNKLIELTVSCWSPTENKFVNLNGTSSQLKFSISNVTGCSPSAIAIDSENKIGYDNTNPNNGKVSLMLTGDPFNQQLFQKTTGTISVLCSISPSVQYQGATKTILLTWSILSQKDKITVSTIGSMYTGDPANLFTITLDSDVSSPKKIKTVTVSDNNILQLTNSGESYSIKALSVDTTKASVLTALKSASIKVSVPGNSYWLPTETTIPLTVYPNNARLQRATPRKYAYLTSGLTHFLGITGDGSLHVWGTNTNGVFASSITTNGVVNIINHPNGKKWIQVESYGYNVYAIDIDGDLWGWGANTNASLGVGRDGIINTPTRIASNLKWKDIACGISHAIGLTQDDKVYGWGDGTYLQNGCGTKTGSSVNVNVPTLIKDIGEATVLGIDALRVSCGPYSSWIVDKNRNLWAFGDLNGMLTSQAAYPVSLKPGTLELNSMASPKNELTNTSTGYYAPLTHHTINYSRHVLGASSAKENIVFAIDKSRQHKWNPHKIRLAGSYTLLSNVNNVSAGANHVMAVYTNNSLTSWGNNIWNQCWTTSPANKHYVYIGQSTLVQSVLGDDGTFIATSPGQSIYIDKDNKLYAIGRNKDNELSALLGVIAPDWYTWPASQSSSYFQIPRVLPGKYISLTSNGSQSFIETAPAV